MMLMIGATYSGYVVTLGWISNGSISPASQAVLRL